MLHILRLVFLLAVLLPLGATLCPTASLALISAVEEEDGDPSAFPWKIKFSNGSVTDNADGTVSVSTAGGGGTVDDDVTVNSTAVDTTANLLDGDIDFTLVDGGVGGPDDITATVGCTDCVALTTETSGNYVGDVADGTGIDGTASGEGATYTPTLDLVELGTETTIAAGDFFSMVDITDNGSQKITFANVESTLSHDALADFAAGEHFTEASIDHGSIGGLTDDDHAHYVQNTGDGEFVDDYVNALINDADSTHTRITITYDDVDNAYDFVVDDMNDTEVNDLSSVVTWANVPDANVDGSNERDEVCNTTDLSSSCEINADIIDFADIKQDNTLAGNPALAVDECYFVATATGGGFICEGSTADTNEQLYKFPDANGADTTQDIAIDGGAHHDGFSDFVSAEHVSLPNTTAAVISDQNAGTDITADLEEETHCSEHDSADVDCSGETIIFASSSVDHANLGSDVITGAAAVGTFTSGDTFLCNEAGVGLRECDYDDLPGGAGGTVDDDVTVNSTAVDTVANFLDDIYTEWALADGGAGGPDDVTAKPDFDQTLAGNPALEVDECIHFKDVSGGGFLCEGSTADTSEQLYRLPDANGADTTEYFLITAASDVVVDAQVPNDITIDLATLATTVTITDDESTADAHEVAFTTDNANLESDGDFNYNPSTGTVAATTFSGALSGNATTATALAANGGNCSAGEIPLGVDTAGAVEGCYEPTEADISDLAHTATDITADIVDFNDIKFDNTLAGNPALGVDECFFISTTTGGGFICEGSTADTSEQLYKFPDNNGADTTQTITLNDEAQTLTNKTIDGTDNTISITEAELETAVSDDNPVFDGDIGSNVQAWDAELDTIAALAETNGNVMFVAGGAWTSDATPAIDLSDATAYPGDSSLVTSGALNSGSITTGFGNIDNGASSIAGGSFDASEGNITNVGDIGLDSITPDGTTLAIGDTESEAITVTGDITATGASQLIVERNFTTDNNTIRATFTNRRGYSAGTGADGIGLRWALQAETETEGTFEQAFIIEGSFDDATAGTVDSSGSLRVLSNSVSTEIVALDATTGATFPVGADCTDCIDHSDMADAAQEHTFCYRTSDPTASTDDDSIWANKTSNDFLITELWCESDQTIDWDLQVDDGTPADVNGADIQCAAGEAEDTTLSGDTTVAAGEELDLEVTSVASTPTWVTVCWTGNWVD